MQVFPLLLALLNPAAAEAAPDALPMIAPRVDEAIHVDGLLDEPAWTGAAAAPFVDNKDGGPARLATTARIFHDGSAFYLGIHCVEPDVPHLAIAPRDESDVDIWRDDSIEVFFDPGQTRSRYYQIIVNAAGKAVAGFNGIYAPAGAICVAVHQGDGAWTIEMRVRFAIFPAGPRPGDRWGFNLFRSRHARSKDDHSLQLAWHPTRGGYRKPHLFGALLLAGRRVPTTLPAADGQGECQAGVLKEAIRTLGGKSRWTPADMSADAAAARAVRLVALASRIARLDEPVLVADAKAITDEPIFPWTVPTIEQLDPVVTAAACPDEFEPATFALFATRDLDDVTIVAGPLTSRAGRDLPPAVIDIRQVLCWYQGGWAHVGHDARTLVPELLVKDGLLIESDPATRQNKLIFSGYPRADAETLQPFKLPAFETKQIWLTFRAPADTPAGAYRGQLRVQADGATIATIPVQLTVYPFKLAPSILSHSLYYRLRPSQTPDPVATMRRMAGEIRNQVEHGINMPSTYIGGEVLRPDGPPLEALEELTRIYRDLGLRDHPLILVTTAVGRQSTPEQLDNIRRMVTRLVEWARARGYSGVYFHAIDEASPGVLKQERLAFQAVHEAGGKVFVACGTDYFDAAGDLLDMPVLSGALRPDVARKAKALGQRVMSYGNPQAGVELPETYRRNYGLKLWVAGYDGGFDYEYQNHDPEQAYDEFRHPDYRNHTMAYPTLAGPPIDTRQWEGWREGVDDVRYLSTLLAALREAKQAGRHEELVRQTPQWLGTITGDEDLDDLRAEMVRRIGLLAGAD